MQRVNIIALWKHRYNLKTVQSKQLLSLKATIIGAIIRSSYLK